MKNLLIIFSILISNFCIAQNPRLNPNPRNIFNDCDLQEKNEKWWREINSEINSTKKIEIVKEKILNDTIYKKYNPDIITHSSPSINIYNTDKNGNLCDVKILFVLKYHKKKNLVLDLLEHPLYINLIDEINSENTNLDLISATKGGTAFYGQRGSSGVVFMTIKDKILQRKINKILQRLRNKRPNG